MAKDKSEYYKEDGDEVTFNLVDKHTVEKLQKDGDIKLPKKKISVPKDEAWNTKIMSSRLLQGIINGDSIDKIKDSLVDIIGTNRASLERNARTMTTGAECSGRIDSYKELESRGVVQKKVWMSTPDDRVRESHLEMDGEEVDTDEEFSNGLMYPGDPSGDPSEVWNCRCTIHTRIVGFMRSDGSISYVKQDDTETLHDKQIEAIKEERKEEENTPIQNNVVQGKDISKTWTRRPDEFDFEIEDVINAQGFDGLPRVVSADEFDRYVDESNFIAQRTYSAPDQETLDAYRDQLYNGKWYVDCSTGGAAHGEGMYTSANYNGELTDGIKKDMIGYGAGKGYNYVETITLSSDAKIIKEEDIAKLKRETAEGYADNMLRNAHIEYSKYERLIYEYSVGIISPSDSKELDAYIDANRESALSFLTKNESDWNKEAENARRIERHIENMDNGVFAAIKGYDAISVNGYGNSGNYTIILNRTKIIFKGE